MRQFLSVAAVAVLLTGGGLAAVQAADALAPPTAYTQMNSPGDGVSSGARRTGNGRMRHRRGYRHHHHHRHHHHRR